MLTNLSYRLRPSRFAMAATLLTGLAGFTLHAQQHADTDTTTTPAANIFAVPSMDLAASSGLNYSSSTASTDVSVDPDAVDHLDLGAATQPPPRRRYGRPRYNDSSHNADGSGKYEFEVGVGMTGPIGNTYHYLNTSYGIQVGGGRDFNKKFGVLAQFDYDRFGFNGRVLTNQINLYNAYCTTALQQAQLCSLFTSLDGSSHVWSFTLNPHYNMPIGESFAVYTVAGGGFFHKTANFTTPAQGVGYDPYYGYYSYTANETVDKYTSNAPGVNGGFGLTYKISRFAGQRLFVEGRYNLMLNSQRHGITAANAQTTYGPYIYGVSQPTYRGDNFYQANSNRTTWLSFKAGLRF